MKIVADKNIPYLKGIAEYFGETEYISGKDFTHQTVKDADVIIVRTVAYIGEEILSGSKVKLVCSATIGFDHIDTQYCDTHGIKWTNAPGCNSGSVMQYIVSSLILLSQKKGFNLQDKTIGIVGVGNVGSKVARACEILGMKVLLNDPPRQRKENSGLFTDLETIKREADIITFHTPLIKSGEDVTFHLANAAFFDELKRKPVIINSARGGIVETEYIKSAIKSGKISGAIIDCWENEPHIDTEYMSMVDIATPHIAGYSADGKANATKMSLNSIAGFYNLPDSPVAMVSVPAPAHPSINLDTIEFSNRIYGAILNTYNALSDWEGLIAHPENFSSLREQYPLRREYFAYSVDNATSGEREILEALGFRF
jgi:erythronate-4-phosphate dehydrogenase